MLLLVTFPTAYNNNAYIFIGAKQKHTCKVPAVSNITDGNNVSATVTYVPGTYVYVCMTYGIVCVYLPGVFVWIIGEDK